MSDDPVVTSSSFGSPTVIMPHRPVKAIPSAKRDSNDTSSLVRKATAKIITSVPEPLPAAVLSPKPRRKTTRPDDVLEAGEVTPSSKNLAKTEKRYYRDIMSRRSCVILADTLDYNGQPLALKRPNL